MPDFAKRSEEKEIMDDLSCSGQVVDRTLQELEFINKWLGGNSITFDGVENLLRSSNNQQVTLADLGCGSGEMLRLLRARLPKDKFRFIGIDANPFIIQYAEKATPPHQGIGFSAMDILSSEFQNQKFDIVIATLFFHHFTNEQLVEILRSLVRQVSVGIVINDLHRHKLAFYSIRILTRLFSKSAMVKYDAPLSVMRGFTKSELEDLLRQAGIAHYSLRWRWAFRWQVIIRK